MTRSEPRTECHFDAPAALLVCYDRVECWKRGYDGKSSGDIDAAIAATHLMLATAALGVFRLGGVDPGLLGGGDDPLALPGTRLLDGFQFLAEPRLHHRRRAPVQGQAIPL